MPRFTLSRRTLLRGALHGIGASVGLPLLEAMLDVNGTALAAGAPIPKRFGAFFWGNGVVASQWFPQATGAGWQLSPLLQPLANVKEYVSVVSNSVVYVPYQVSGHFGALMSITSGALGKPQGGLNYAYAGKTFDQAIADKIGTTTRFRSLHLGVASTDKSDADFGAVSKSISHNGPNSPNLPEFNPIAFYDRVFGAGFTAPGSTPSVASVTLAARKSVLDVVAADTRALQAKLGTNDRRRLDQHLQGIADLEKQLGGVAPPPRTGTSTCVKPTRPTNAYPAIDAEQVHWEELSALHTDLLAMALSCDQTRVFTYRFSPCNDYTIYPGFPTFVLDPNDSNTGTSMHAYTHQDGGDQPNVQKCVTYAMSKLAALLEKLKATPEGTGNLLDACAIMAFSEHTEGRTHNSTQPPGIPVLIAGRAGGALVHPGIHYKAPLQGDRASETRGRNVSAVPLTLMQAVDAGISTWGVAEGQATKVISELLV
ncbi:MAG: DUF1552 domain-containing protein [Myxococcaceae bacterium]|nr:DUF1552 domain-containing protein [Myxococcaceae bacterium]